MFFLSKTIFVTVRASTKGDITYFGKVLSESLSHFVHSLRENIPRAIQLVCPNIFFLQTTNFVPVILVFQVLISI